MYLFVTKGDGSRGEFDLSEVEKAIFNNPLVINLLSVDRSVRTGDA